MGRNKGRAAPGPRSRELGPGAAQAGVVEHDDAATRTGTLALAVAAVVVGVSVLIYLMVLSWPFTVDDAFITLRYSANLASGHGPTFNPGQPPIEGYTTFLWMLLAAIPHWLGTDAVVFVKGLGIVAILAALGVTAAVTRRLAADATSARDAYLPAAFAVLALGLFHATAVHAVSGMETGLATLLLTSLVYAALRGNEGRWLYVAPALALLLGATRPEANAVAPFILAGMVAAAPAARRRHAVVACCLLYGLPGAVYFAWRWSYYGLMLPIPFYLKVTHEGGFAGAPDVYSYLELMLILVGVLWGVALLKPERRVLAVLAAALLWTGVCVTPAPVMGYEWRYCFPATPLFFVVAARGLAALVQQRWRSSDPSQPGKPARTELLRRVLLIAVVGLALGAGFAKTGRGQIRERRSYGQALQQAHAWMGRTLAELLPVDAGSRPPTLAIGDCGAAPYYSRWRVIDTAGLNEPTIGTTGDHSPELVFSFEPDLIVLVSVRPDKYENHHEFPWETALYAACVDAGMVRLAAVRFSARSFLWIMAAPSNPLAQPVRQLLRARSSMQVPLTGASAD